MSRIEKLGIQGVRSFGPDDMRRIEFYSPLTLILGQNGCGKTTIIESLKFITTGELPPGCGKGAAFIHDPKMAKDTVVRGQVKLRFKSTKGKTVTGCRSVEVTQKAKNLVFNSIDSTITYDGPDGKQTSISNKCIDFHTEITSLLGVAKPILDNVIFCHQEDANWPLDEGKKVKERFDAIFNATKYIKCLDTFRKLRKEKKLAVNGMQETLAALKQSKEQAVNLRKDLEDTLKKQQELKEEQDQLVKSQGPVHKRIKEIQAVERDIANIEGEIHGNEYQLKSIREMQNELKSNLTENLTCSDKELLNLILDFERNTKVKEAEQQKTEFALREANGKIANLKDEESKALRLMGNLEAAQKRHTENVRKRDALLEQLVSKYSITGYAGRSDFEIKDSDNILIQIEKFLEGEKSKLNVKKKEFEEKEAEVQNEMDKLRSEEATLEHDIATLLKQTEEKTRLMRTHQHKLSMNEDELSSTNIDDLKKSIEDIVNKIQKEKEKVNVDKLSTDIRKKVDERENVEKKLEEVKRKVAKMNKMAQARSQYDIYVKDRNTLLQKNQILKRKNEEDFQSIFNGPVGDNVRNELEAQMANMRRQIRDCGEKKRVLEKRKTENAMKIENEKQSIDKLEKEIKGFQSKLEDVCIGGDLEDAIRRCKEQIDALLKTKGDQDSSTVMFRTFMDKIRGGEGCPLCHRNFEEGYEKQMLVEEIESKLTRLPHEMTQLRKNLITKEELHERLLQLRPQKERADKAEEELTAKRLKLQGYKSEREKVDQELDNCSSQLVFIMSEEETCMRVQSDVVALDSNMKTIRQLEDKISNIQATLGTSDDDLSMDELVKLQTDMEHKVKSLRKECEKIQEEVLEHKAQLQRLHDRKIELSTRELELKMKQQETEKMKDEIEKMKEQKREMEERIEDSRFAVAPIKYQLKEKVEAKKAILLQKDKVIDAENKKIECTREDKRKASEVHRSVREYVESGRESALADGKRNLRSLQDEAREEEANKKNLNDKVNTILKELTTQRERKRSLDDEKKIRDKEVEARKLENIIASLKEKEKDFDIEKISREKQQLLREETRIFRDRATLEGRLEELTKKKKDVERYLNMKDIKNAERNYKEKFIQIKCVDVACEDINKYFRALETAVMKFHQEKMSTINSIIRELWRTTYRGNDIDYIEIKTDDIESQGTDKRRTYNYRVVMVKNDVEMDMRARCSAGQKVLASLIIRMALAETFSTNCGILALDEPTTNLDRENIEALSLALLNIVNKRSHQKNFQLVVITHDEEFLERMSRADFIQYYHRVSRDERGLSVITRKSAQMLD